MTKRQEILIRTSERTTFTRCRQRWYWAYVERLKPKRVAPALEFGSLIHEALAVYYKKSTLRTQIRRGPHPKKTFINLYQRRIEEELPALGMYTEDEEWEDALELGVEMLTNYIDHYGRDEQYQVLCPEVPFEIDIHDPDTGRYLFTYVGTFDAVIRDLNTGKIGLFEHKTAKSISTEHLTMDEQAGSYFAFAQDWMRERGVLGPKERLDFILYNFLRKGKKDPRPQNNKGQYLNSDGSVSKRQPSPLFERKIVRRSNKDRRNTMLRAIEQGREMVLARKGELPIYKTILNGCTGMLGCEFRDMCELHEAGADWKSIRDATMTTWEPYEGHEMKGEE